ncbi:MAG: IS66 family transposase [Proteobacteria bacterium]|nr:IS66 family transposase [Pseudomonadota bacterium]
MNKKELSKLNKDELVDLCYNLINTVNKLTHEVKELRTELSKFKTKKNSNNSSIPPSQDQFREKTKSLREKSQRKPGGQPGHKGKNLKMVSNPDETIQHMPKGKCSWCGEVLLQENNAFISKRQVVEIPKIKPLITEHRLYENTCKCGIKHEGVYPHQVKSHIQYGSNIKTLTAYLHCRQYISYQRIAEFFRDVINIPVSEGTIDNLLTKTSKIVQPLYNAIKQEVNQYEVVGSDETGINIGGKNNWAWTWQTPFSTYITISDNRGSKTINSEFPNGFPSSVLVSDAWAAQMKTQAKDHQLCLAHILRELNYLHELHKHSWTKDIKDLFKHAIKLKNRLCVSDYYKPLPERDLIEKAFSCLLKQELPPDYKGMIRLQKRFRKYKYYIFNFLYKQDVPYENNASERAIRNIKVKQKISGQFKTWRGAKNFIILRSVIDTLIKKEANIMDSLNLSAKLYYETLRPSV